MPAEPEQHNRENKITNWQSYRDKNFPLYDSAGEVQLTNYESDRLIRQNIKIVKLY